MKKSEALKHWQDMPANQNIVKHFTAISPEARGSRYGACGIRIDGNPQFVDSVLSHLKDLLCCENHVTRLSLSLNQVDGSGIGKALDNADSQAVCCYIRLYLRGRQGAIASQFFDRHLDTATKQFGQAL